MEKIDQRGTLHSTMAVRFAGNESIFFLLVFYGHINP